MYKWGDWWLRQDRRGEETGEAFRGTPSCADGPQLRGRRWEGLCISHPGGPSRAAGFLSVGWTGQCDQPEWGRFEKLGIVMCLRGSFYFVNWSHIRNVTDTVHYSSQLWNFLKCLHVKDDIALRTFLCASKHTLLEAFLLLAEFIQTRKLNSYSKCSFIFLWWFLLNGMSCFTFLSGKKKQWFQAVLLWEPKALQVDKALSGNGVHFQAGCPEWHRYQVWRFLVLLCWSLRVFLSCCQKAWGRPLPPLNQFKVFREGVLIRGKKATSEVIMPLGVPFAILQARMQRPWEVSLRTKMKVTVQILKGIPLAAAFFSGPVPFSFVTLANCSFCYLFQLCVFPDAKRGVLGQPLSSGWGRICTGGEKIRTARAPPLGGAGGRQEQVYSEVSVETGKVFLVTAYWKP